MRALLTPYPQRDAGIVIFKPGSGLMNLFHQRRLLISLVPDELKDFPIGEIPDVEQALVDDERLRAFFSDKRVIDAAGGIDSMRMWLERGQECQWTLGDGYHDKNMVVTDYEGSAVRLCWHHDLKFKDHLLPELDRLAYNNQANFVIKSAVAKLQLPPGHQLSFFELCWWAVTMGVIDVMPNPAARHALRWKPADPIKSVGREADIQPESAPRDVLVQRAEKVKPILALVIDPDTPESYMLRPKRRRYENPKYTQWVKRQPCCGCGNQADDPHHITGNGFGGMATKAHDLFVIPLCRRCHDALHANTAGWEKEHGDQVLLALKTLDRALAMGVIATGKEK
ncbi:MAG: DUF968 domain-containing protein [Rouxiella aceris]|uniref:DUF968 domain-containing protein n=1 Tax=Rouxiella aceris TaxID=2703884 RepID=UPI002849E5C7|nr:DUF968 domain-containing protein [Rouxiella aceris]MDR3431068.1 DUF968 domain-containing protein [Rouxiella aceris]